MGVPADIVMGAILVSGLYELTPLQQTTPNEWLSLSVAGAEHVQGLLGRVDGFNAGLRQQRDIQRLGHFGCRRAYHLRRRRGVNLAEFASRGPAGQAGTPDDQRLAHAVFFRAQRLQSLLWPRRSPGRPSRPVHRPRPCRQQCRLPGGRRPRRTQNRTRCRYKFS